MSIDTTSAAPSTSPVESTTSYTCQCAVGPGRPEVAEPAGDQRRLLHAGVVEQGVGDGDAVDARLQEPPVVLGGRQALLVEQRVEADVELALPPPGDREARGDVARPPSAAPSARSPTGRSRRRPTTGSRSGAGSSPPGSTGRRPARSMASSAGDHCHHSSHGITSASSRRIGTTASSAGPAAYMPKRLRLAPSGVGTTKAIDGGDGVEHGRGPDQALLDRDEDEHPGHDADRQQQRRPAERERPTLGVERGDEEHRRHRQHRQRDEPAAVAAARTTRPRPGTRGRGRR